MHRLPAPSVPEIGFIYYFCVICIWGLSIIFGFFGYRPICRTQIRLLDLVLLLVSKKTAQRFNQ